MLLAAALLAAQIGPVEDRSSVPIFSGAGAGRLIVTEVPSDVPLCFFVVTCEHPTESGCRFSVTRSGEAARPAEAASSSPYKDDDTGVGFRIESGAGPFEAGDTFSFVTYEDRAMVDDLLERWADTYVRWVASREEKERFAALTDLADRFGFIESFWKRRDPTPSTIANQAREEHARRFAFAVQRFGAGTPGWATDRGKVYILLGAPSAIERSPAGRTSFERPSEVWTYNDPPSPKLPASMTVSFVDFTATGRYELVSSSNLDILAPLRTNFGYSLSELDAIGLLRSGGSLLSPETGLRYDVSPTDLAAGRLDFERDLLEIAKVPRLSLPNLREVAEASASFPSIPLEVEASTFRAAGERSLVPIMLAIPYARLTPEPSEAAAGFRYQVDVVIQFEGPDIPSIEDRLEVLASQDELEGYRKSDLLFEASALMPPGRYEMLVTVRDNPSGAVGQARRSVLVEDDEAGAFALSSLLLVTAAAEVEVPASGGTGAGAGAGAGAARAPFQFGSFRLVPSPRRRFRDRLTAYVEAYGIEDESDAELRVDFFILREGRLFSKVAPSYHRPGRGGELAIRSDISLVGLPPGDYALRCRVTATRTSESAEREQTFSIDR